MRQIEQNLINAIRGKDKSWSQDNTTISYNENTETYDVFLHGNKIASIDYDNREVRLSSCGWRTSTTKSRLNVILTALRADGGIRQIRNRWQICTNDHNDHYNFYDGFEVSF